MKNAILKVVCLSIYFISVQSYASWPNWRGPNYTGSTLDSKLGEIKFPESQIWKTAISGPSASSPVVDANRVFITCSDKNSKSLYAVCYDAITGKEIWRKEMDQSKSSLPRNNHATPSPVLDGDRAYFMFGTGKLVVTDYEGKELWQKNIVKEYGIISIIFGYSSSPCVYDGKVYIQILRNKNGYGEYNHITNLNSFVIAFDATTGKEVWKVKREGLEDASDEGAEAYSTPIIFENIDKKELVVTGADNVTAYDLQTGKENWRYNYNPENRRGWRGVPTPIQGFSGTIICPRPRGEGVFCLRPRGEGKLDDLAKIWDFTGSSPDTSTPLVSDKYCYIMDGTSGKKILTCVNIITGRARWNKKMDSRANWWAAPVACDGQIFLLSDAGEFLVIEDTPKQFVPLHSSNFPEKVMSSTPAISDNKIFIKTKEALYCLGQRP